MSRRKGRGAATGTVTIRMTRKQVVRIGNEAAAALMSRSAYIVARLCGDEPQNCPSLAVLARVIAMHQRVEQVGNLEPAMLDELKHLVLHLTEAARREAEALG